MYGNMFDSMALARRMEKIRRHNEASGGVAPTDIVLDSTLALVRVTANPGNRLVRLDIGQGYGTEDRLDYPLTANDARRLGAALMRRARELDHDERSAR